MKVLRSIIGMEIAIPKGFIPGITCYIQIANSIWAALVINTGVVVLIVCMYFQAKYSITEKPRFAKAVLFADQKIPVSGIKSITKINNPLSPPAFSMDRIQLFYGKYKNIIISPNDQTTFVNHLRRINPDIQFISKY